LRVIQENFEEGYVKAKKRKRKKKKKSEMEGECPINSKKSKRGHNKCQKSTKKNNQVSCLLVCLG